MVALSRLYRRSIVVYNQVDSGKIQEQVFLGGVDVDKNSVVTGKLSNPVRVMQCTTVVLTDFFFFF